MNTITCPHCGEAVEVDKALEGQIEARVLAAELHKHDEELAKLKAEQEVSVAKASQAASEFAKRQLEGEKELLKKQAEAILTPDAIDMLASRLRTPLQIQQHLTFALDAGYQAIRANLRF